MRRHVGNRQEGVQPATLADTGVHWNDLEKSMNQHTDGDPRNRTEEISRRLDDLVKELREGVKAVTEPRAQALFETSAEVLLGLRTAYEHYEKGEEEAWRR